MKAAEVALAAVVMVAVVAMVAMPAREVWRWPQPRPSLPNNTSRLAPSHWAHMSTPVSVSVFQLNVDLEFIIFVSSWSCCWY